MSTPAKNISHESRSRFKKLRFFIPGIAIYIGRMLGLHIIFRMRTVGGKLPNRGIKLRGKQIFRNETARSF